MRSVCIVTPQQRPVFEKLKRGWNFTLCILHWRSIIITVQLWYRAFYLIKRAPLMMILIFHLLKKCLNCRFVCHNMCKGKNWMQIVVSSFCVDGAPDRQHHCSYSFKSVTRKGPQKGMGKYWTNIALLGAWWVVWAYAFANFTYLTFRLVSDARCSVLCAPRENNIFDWEEFFTD